MGTQASALQASPGDNVHRPPAEHGPTPQPLPPDLTPSRSWLRYLKGDQSHFLVTSQAIKGGRHQMTTHMQGGITCGLLPICSAVREVLACEGPSAFHGALKGLAVLHPSGHCWHLSTKDAGPGDTLSFIPGTRQVPRRKSSAKLLNVPIGWDRGP